MITGSQILTSLEKASLFGDNYYVRYSPRGTAVVLRPEQITQKRQVYRTVENMLNATSVKKEKQTQTHEYFRLLVRKPKVFLDTIEFPLNFITRNGKRESGQTDAKYALDEIDIIYNVVFPGGVTSYGNVKLSQIDSLDFKTNTVDKTWFYAVYNLETRPELKPKFDQVLRSLGVGYMEPLRVVAL